MNGVEKWRLGKWVLEMKEVGNQYFQNKSSEKYISTQAD